MKTLYLTLVMMAVALLLESCSSTNGQSSTQLATNFIHRQHVVAMTTEKYPPKNPKTIAVYNEEHKPLTPYRIIGIATVSKRNLIGMQRQDATVHDMIKNLAASIGGDGLINVSNNEENIQASVIAYQKIMI